ncbi:cytochrome P450 [Zoogloea dura]|jgi:cytochrome P450|uniref:Cytochrome P450 n=1 Tax=Zoogloea dura TaxID=2728840 RepID=A0A848G9W2_9RHOO|nr:cytochrome P450 [Zoogloea dura]NML27626.1 cytochrome P450 [Zoogloea dura]
MATQYRSEKLEKAFAALSKNYRGLDVDLYAVSREKRQTTPVMEGDFMASLSVPTHAGQRHGHPTYAVFKYNDIKAVLQDAATFTSGFIAKGLGTFFGGDGLIIIAMDGDQHRKARGLLQPVFTPQSVNPWRVEIERSIREEFIAPLVPNKRADLMDFALYFPIRVIYALIGFPQENIGDFYEYAAMGLTILAGPKNDPAEEEAARQNAVSASQGLYDAVIKLVAQRRAEGANGDDLISRLIRAEFEARRLDDMEIATFVRSLVAAGGETTTRTFSSVMTLLLQRPALLARVRDDRSLVSKLIDEAIRFEPTSTVKVRQAARDVEIGGVKIPQGALVQCVIASANRDEDVFENADEFDIDRKLKPSFTFGYGPHMCIGQFVAKLELSAAVNAVLDLFPNLRLDPDQPAPEIQGGQLRGASSIPVIWD